MSQLGITTDLLINRTSWTAELRAAENDVKSLAQRLAASPLKIPAVLSIDATKLRAAIAQAQAVANANPITIPVTYGMPGGMPGGGGGFPTGAASPNWSYLLNQNAAAQAGAGASNVPGAGGTPTGGGVGGFLSRSGGGMRLFRYAAVIRGAYDTAVAGGYAATALGSEASHLITGRGYSTAELQGRADAIEAGQESIKKLPFLGGVIEGTGAGINRFASATMNFARGRGFESDIGYGERLKEVVKLEDEHTKKLEAQAHQHRAIGEHLEREVATLNRRTAILNNPGMGGVALANLNAADATQALTLELSRPEMRDAKGRLTGNAADYRTARLRNIEAQRQASAGEAFRSENAANARGALAVSDIQATAHEAEMRSQGRGTEAGYSASRRAIQERLTRLGIAYQAEGDPAQRARLNTQYQAELIAGNQEVGALNAGMARETTQDVRGAQRRGYIADLEGAGYGRQASLYAQTSAIDERLRRQREEVQATQDPTVRANLNRRLGADTAAGEKEKAAIIAEDWRRTLDAIAGYTIQKDQAILATAKNDGQQQLRIFDETTARLRERMKDRSNEEKKAFEEARAAERKATEEAIQERHMDMRQQARDILLNARGKGGLASELDIEDEFRRNVKAAGTDSRAQHDAQELTKARLEAFIRGSWQPQIFNSWAGFDQAAQMNLINRDAQGLKRAVNLRNALNGFQGGGWDLSATGGGAEGFGPEDVKKFSDASDKLSDAADKLGQNTLAVVKF